jgi:membrane-bound serine protease (ClpP class)
MSFLGNLERPVSGRLHTQPLLTSAVVRHIGFVLIVLALPLVALAQDDDGGIDVVDVSGPLDSLALGFMAESIEDAAASGQELVVLQINSKAVLDGPSYDRLIGLVDHPAIPVAVWIGPSPAVAYGGAFSVADAASQNAIAPGSSVGFFNPVVLGEEREEVISPQEPISGAESNMELQPTLRQYLQDLDGRTFETNSGPVTVSTLREFDGGVTLKTVTFMKPGLATRFFRLAVTPEAAFFFLVVGLSIVTFEFFALGPGVAAGVAAISLILAGWGIVNLPIRWWALALAIVGWGVLTAAYQRGGVLVMTIGGTVLLQIAGMFYVDGQGQIDPRWYLVLPSVVAVLFFFLIAMPTVQRARLSTQTIGREGLVGHVGTAIADFDPEGLVEVDGARWRATAHREAELKLGSQIVVSGVDGLFLEVDRIESERET